MSTVTAVDYIQSQLELEREARELMPYDPQSCTYTMGELRQPVFACLTCSRQNDNTPIGVCYSCSIQCHSTHDLVELFAKRSFVCDCGTTKMSKTKGGACKTRARSAMVESTTASNSIRRRTSSTSSSVGQALAAEDIPSSGNQYNHNYKGFFCSCEKPYNPLEETGNMIQCHFGEACGEDWYHEECILGYKRGSIRSVRSEDSTSNQLDDLAPPGEDAASDTKQPKEEEANTQSEEYDDDDEDNVSSVPYFPRLDHFEMFICWKCVAKYPKEFEKLRADPEISFVHLPYFKDVTSSEAWELKYKNFIDPEPQRKKVKLESESGSGSGSGSGDVPYSIFLKPGFKSKLKELADNSMPFLQNHSFLYEEDPIYEPPEDEDDDASSGTGSLLELGAGALQSLPREQAIEGLQAYDKIKSKLRDFFRPFAEDGKVVTEDEVRNFFSKVKEEDSNS
ncbi:hypothetical protein CAAN1_03S02894 [[Candida] anglica]|uniref:UBR-type domain-containing protein n=1 Tax=[Candida] anglica TaxID=148631 RepID=A0ABP0EI29_9ASCO